MKIDLKALVGYLLTKKEAIILVVIGGFLLLLGFVSLIIPKKQPITLENNEVVTIESSGSALPKVEIFVDVEGAVFNPGVYKLRSGDRVQDALTAAGGMAGQADREYVAKTMNLAAKLVDGGKVYIPFTGEVKGAAVAGYENMGSISGGGAVININSAGSAELDLLTGVGPVTAQKIIDSRPYGKIEDLVEKKIVSKSVFEKIKEKIAVY